MSISFTDISRGLTSNHHYVEKLKPSRRKRATSILDVHRVNTYYLISAPASWFPTFILRNKP